METIFGKNEDDRCRKKEKEKMSLHFYLARGTYSRLRME